MKPRNAFRELVEYFAHKHGPSLAEHHIQLDEGEVSDYLEHAAAEDKTLPYTLLDCCTPPEMEIIVSSLRARNSSGVVQAVLRGVARRRAVAEILATAPELLRRDRLERDDERLSA